MVKQIVQLGILSAALSFSISGYSQIKKEKTGDKNFDRLAYVDAIKVYERIADKGYVNTSILQNLADAYYFNGKLVEANKWYAELFEGTYDDKDTSKLSSEYYYRYAQTLKAVENYAKSQELLEQFAALEKEDSRTALFNKNRDYLAHIENHSDRYDIRLLDLNTEYSDYGGTMIGDKFVFTSARATDHQNGNQIHAWTNESFTSLYSSTVGQNGFEEPVLFAEEINSKVNDATAVFTKDGNTMYFTRNNSKASGKSKQNRDKTSLLKLYKAVKQSDGKWGLVEELPFNSDNFNTAHPALTPDGKWLYFVSDRKGTLGQSDLFRVGLYEDGTYGEVENLGNSINTEGRESFPFISSDNQLYFSSDGHPGLGGMDVFVAKLYPNGSFGPVVNMGAPINSSLDDFGFYLDPAQGKGFVSSNRAEGKGADDIYFLAEKPCKQSIEGIVYDKDTNEVLADALVVISDALYQKSDTLYTNSKGYYVTSLLDCGNKYRIKAEKALYNTVEVAFNINREPGVKTVNIGLEKTEKPLEINDDLFKKLQLQPIYFDFDKSNIRRDASIELMKVVEVMKEYPSMKLDVRSHTDSRGNDAYNMQLSDRRVKSTIKWMIEQGIDPGRLTGRGYGESQLQNKCSNGVPCTAEEHQLNRRSEFIILEM
ncbi:PD40 domain-containing protein [Myroides sp. NP-2]|uniref:OmpA family protein n=1 Tax=Myroides sp. NP-2 TaxID=2759945 RepID=UPI0015F8511B|nr:OmpA family protein [Myroides sp. NP-2]MBB1149500.1 PD40 domain-containing protein [Myroides sp. NP-2]